MGFTFNGTHSDTYRILMRSRNRQALPPASDEYVNIPGRDGSIIFPGKLQDREIEIDCGIKEDSIPDLRTAMRNIASWLNTSERKQLIFDDEDDKIYMVKISAGIDLNSLGTLGDFRLAFRCDPFAYGAEETDNFVSDSVTVANSGTVEAPCIITATMTGSASYFRVTLGSQYVEIEDALVLNDVVVINTGTGLVTVNGSRALDVLDWQNSEFFQLSSGNNTLTITPTGKCTANVKHTPRWL